ncbi:MAG: hypothetical protein HY889_05215 [Deltaproteobacteria bacterium]|nr:hypothetical protein [Deltaproteobacteria bacterium]
MVKIDSVTGQNTPLLEKTTSSNARGYNALRQDSEDSVKISEEGKKKHIFGQLMARISEGNGAKKDIDR